MKLTALQIRLIRDYVNATGLTIETLKDDLLDHLCCVIENILQEGGTFNDALKEAIYELAPAGLMEIERETIALLNFKKYQHMKKVMFFIGCICAMGISMGWLLKFLNVALPVGNLLFGLGAFGFLGLFLPMIAVTHFRASDKPITEKLRYIFGISSTIVIGIAILARLMRLPGADEVMIAGLLVFTFGFIPLLFFTMYKKSAAINS